MTDASDIAKREQYIESQAERIADLEAEVLKWQVEAGKFGPGMECMEDLLQEARSALQQIADLGHYPDSTIALRALGKPVTDREMIDGQLRRDDK